MVKNKIKMVAVGLFFGRHIVEDHILNGPAGEFIELVGVCDLKRALVEPLVERYGLRAYKNLESILLDPTIEAVGLFTSPVHRADLIRDIIRASKHVITTKPFELDPEAALVVLHEARSLHKVIHMNSPSPLMDAESAQILDWVEEFDLGRPVSFHWETHANYQEQPDGSWYDDSERCPVAPVFRLGIYAINQFVRLLGDVDQVRVVESRIRTGRPTSDNALLSLLFRNGVIGSIHASFCVKNKYSYANDLTFNYERGTIRSEAIAEDRYGASRKRLWIQAAGKTREGSRGEAFFDRADLSGGYQWSAFYEAVRNGGCLEGEFLPEQIAAGIRVVSDMAKATRGYPMGQSPEYSGDVCSVVGSVPQ